MASKQVVFKEGARTLIPETTRYHRAPAPRKSLRARIDELAAADRRRNEFLTMLSHELRNPLAPLRTAMKALTHAGSAEGSFDAARVAMTRQVDAFGRIIDDLQDAAHISRGQITLNKERIELQKLVTDAVEQVRPELDSRHHRLVMDLPPQPVALDGDAARLTQTFVNLLDNAVRYTPDGRDPCDARPARSELSPTRRYAVVRVRDSGIGIASEMLPRVFDLFAQADGAGARGNGHRDQRLSAAPLA